MTATRRRLTQKVPLIDMRRSSRGGFGMADDGDEDPKARLEALERKLASKRKVEKPTRHQDEHYSQAQMAWRMVIELVAGLVIGFGIGFGLDTLFGTMPLLLIVFTLLGFAAGIKTVLRTASEMQTDALAEAGDDSERD